MKLFNRFSISVGVVTHFGVTFDTYDMLWITVICQIYSLVPAIYDSSRIVVTRSYT